jgi:hypothetical protein
MWRSMSARRSDSNGFIADEAEEWGKVIRLASILPVSSLNGRKLASKQKTFNEIACEYTTNTVGSKVRCGSWLRDNVLSRLWIVRERRLGLNWVRIARSTFPGAV